MIASQCLKQYHSVEGAASKATLHSLVPGRGGFPRRDTKVFLLLTRLCPLSRFSYMVKSKLLTHLYLSL